jgi:hypothetical protein
MNEADDIEQARQRAITRLQAKADEAAAMATDRSWQHGPFNVQRWVQRAFNSALAVLRQEEPADGGRIELFIESRRSSSQHARPWPRWRRRGLFSDNWSSIFLRLTRPIYCAGPKLFKDILAASANFRLGGHARVLWLLTESRS